MWNNPFQNPIPQFSSSREAGGITIPPLKFSSPRQAQTDQLSAGSSVASAISLDKLKLFYQQKIDAMKQDLQAQAIQQLQRRKTHMQDILVKSIYSKQQVKQIILNNDKQLTQLLNQLYIQKVSQEEAKLGILETFNQAVSVVDLIQIINDLVKRLSENPIKVDLKTLNRISQEQDQNQNIYFINQVEVLKSQNIIVINKLKNIIQKRRSRNQGERSQFNLSNIPKLQNQRVFPSSNSKETHQVGQILYHILSQIQQLKNQINYLNGKIQSHHLTDKTMASIQKQYGKATQKVNVLENEISILNRELISRSKQNIQMQNHNEQLQMAILKIQNLEREIDEATYNFNKQTEQLQYCLDQKQKKVKMLTEALNNIEVYHQKQAKQYQKNLSNEVDLLLSQIDRLTRQLQKAQLQIQGYQLTIARLNKITKDKSKQQDQQNAQNELIRYIQQQCEQMTNQNQKVIQKLDQQKDVKEEKLKHIYYAVSQKSHRTNQSRQKDYPMREKDDIDNNLINNLYNKIDDKIEQLKILKQRSISLQQQNLELKQAMLLLKGQFENMQGNFSNRSGPKSRNLIAQMIDSYSIQQKSFMSDCFGIVIKILSQSISSEAVLARCQNLLKCAQTQLQKNEKILFSKTPLFYRQQKHSDKNQKVRSIPTLQISKKLQIAKDNDKTGKIKRKQVG